MIQETDPENLSEDQDHIIDSIEDNENEEEEMGNELILIAVCAFGFLHLGMASFFFWHTVMDLLGEYLDF